MPIRILRGGGGGREEGKIFTPQLVAYAYMVNQPMPSAMVPVTPGTLPGLAEPAMPCNGNTATVALVLAWYVAISLPSYKVPKV